MTSTPANSKPGEFDELMERLLDHSLDESEETRLQTLLRGNPDLQDRYADYVLLHAALSWRGGILGIVQNPLPQADIPQSDAMVFDALPDDQALPDEETIVRGGEARSKEQGASDQTSPDEVTIVPPYSSTAGVAGRIHQPPRKLGGTKRRAFWGRAWQIAAAVALMVGGVLWVHSVQNGQPTARITTAVNAHWDKPSAPADGDAMPTGTVELADGYLQLTFKSGAQVLMHGPAEFAVLSGNSLKLNRGALTAVVPHDAIGFTVESPTCKTQDLGTEFGVRVHSDGASDVEVFKGSVQVTASSGSAEPVRVTAYQIARVRGGQSTPLIEAGDGAGFVRTTVQSHARAHELAWWRFEAGQAGQPVPANGDLTGAVAVHDASPNGNDLFALAPETAPRFSDDVPSDRIPLTGDGNHGSIDTRDEPQAPYLTRDLYTRSRNSHPAGVDLEDAQLAQWTVEASVKFAALNPQGSERFESIVARDGIGADAAESRRAPFYLQLNADNFFQVVFCDAARRAHVVIARQVIVQPDQWYHLAAVSDGRTLSLYVDALDGRGFQKAAFVQLPNDDETALAKSSDKTHSWVVGRAMYEGKFTDQLNGWVDEVRISDCALQPSQFLFGGSSQKSGE